VYKKYINPAATEAQILRVGHAMVAFYAIVMGLAGLIFYYIGISMGWLYVRTSPPYLVCILITFQTFMGTLLGSAVVPIAIAVTWKRANRLGCIVGSIAGFAAGITAWLVATSVLNHGIINVTVSLRHLYYIPSLTHYWHEDERW
jgi:urea-proton symporter